MYSNHKATRRVSRRVVLGTAAGAGAAGAAAAIGIKGLVGDDAEKPRNAAAITAGGEGDSATAMYSSDTADNALVAFAANPDTNTVKIFFGTNVVDVDAPDLVAAIKRAAKI
jgi:hypothetical protein